MVGKFGICAAFKNEGPDILEWISYHWSLGFSGFVLYDNDSDDAGAWRILNSRFSRFVTVIKWPKHLDQMDAFRYFCANFRNSFEWVAFIDIDEFVFPITAISIGEAFSSFRKGSTVLVQWLTFGPSGHITRPSGLILENYVLRFPETHPRCGWVKSIVSMSEKFDVGDTPHVLGGDRVYVNTRNEAVPPHAEISPCHENIVINHYYTKSREDWERKKLRGTAIEPRPPSYYVDQNFDDHSSADVLDLRISRFVRLVKYCLHT